MNKHLYLSGMLACSVFLLAGCNQDESVVGTSQLTQEQDQERQINADFKAAADATDGAINPIDNTSLDNPSFEGQPLQKTTALPNINVPGLIAKAKTYLGTPYVFGSRNYDLVHTFDCSSFTQYIFGKYGVSLRRGSQDQANQGVRVRYRSSLVPGNLIFYYINTPGQVNHVGIYIGNGQMIHASPSGGKGVQISSITSGYWYKHFLFGGKVAY